MTLKEKAQEGKNLIFLLSEEKSSGDEKGD